MILKNSIFQRLFFLFTVFLPVTGFGQTNHSQNHDWANTLTQQMALAQQLSEPPSEIKAQFEQNPLQLSSAKNNRMLDLFDKAYDSALVVNDFKTVLREKITDQRVQKISQWLDEQSTQAITGADREFYTLQGKRKRVITMYEMDRKQPAQKRTNLISSLADTTSAAQASVESSIIILRSVIKALNNLSEKRNFSDTQINTIVDNFKMQMQAQASEQIQNKLMVTYYNIQLPALRKYVTFMQSETGQWLNKAISQSMKTAYKNAGDRFLQSINQ